VALDAASGAASWTIFDATGVRPEYLWCVLWSESNLDPSRPNAAGQPYYGINQVSGAYLAKLGIDVADYLTWSASRQLTTVVLPYLRGVVGWTGETPGSATRLYQANFYPASLKTARDLGSVIVWRGSAAYAANAGLDPAPKKGAITVADLARAMTRASNAPSVLAATAASYLARPSESPPEEPVYGTDFADPLVTGALSTAILGIAGEMLRRIGR
jgi:hypothetical protein